MCITQERRVLGWKGVSHRLYSASQGLTSSCSQIFSRKFDNHFAVNRSAEYFNTEMAHCLLRHGVLCLLLLLGNRITCNFNHIHTVQITRNLYASDLHSRVINTRQSSTRDLEFEFSHSRSRVTFEFECSSIRVVSFSTRAR